MNHSYNGDARTHTVTTSAGTTTLSYDYEDRVTGITYPSSATNSFAYNAWGTRVVKVDSTGTSIYKHDGPGVEDPVLSDGSIAYTPGVSERKSGTSTFDHRNYLGTYTRQTNSSQSTTATRAHDAFGTLESTTGSPQSGFGFVGSQGYQEDSDSGLKLLGHRYYDSFSGRFLTRDVLKDGRNWYGYCDNNPNTVIDPTGNQSRGGGGKNRGRGGNNKGRGDDPKYDPDQWSNNDLREDSQRNPENRVKNENILKERKVKNKNKRNENNYHSDPVYSPHPIINPQPIKQVAQGASAGVILYRIISEGSRVFFPPRNLIPIP